MRTLFKLVKAGSLAITLAVQSMPVAAAVLIWASDIRSGQPVNAEQSEWMRYLQSQSAGSETPLATPASLGVADQYPLHLRAEPDVGALMTSRLATGSDAAVWVQLTNTGLQWVMEQGGEAQQLRTPASSDGLTLGLNWIGMQLSMMPAVSAEATPITSASAPTTTLSTPIAAASEIESQLYQHPGQTLVITGLFDGSDYMRLTQSIRSLEGVDYLFPARIEGTEVELVVGSMLAPAQLRSLLEQQPWLRRTDTGGLRWDALAMPLPTAQLQNRQTSELQQAQ